MGEINFDYTYYRLTHKRYSNMDGNNVAYTYHPGGRIESITDGTGHRKLGYDALGNLVHEDRYIAIPNSTHTLAFHTQYTYDSWGRMRTLRYPDGEQVTYTYRWGGDLFSVHGTKGADSCRYVDSIAYNAYGQRAYIHYGNGTMASYTYDALHRLIGLESSDSLGNPMQQIKYAFDPSSNITHIANNAPNIGPLGGRYQNYYKYDPLHRLTRAGGSNQYRFEQAFELSPAGRPLSMSTNGMVKHYAYGEHTPPHAPQRIMVERHTLHDLRWDPAGNLGQVSTLAHDRGDVQSRFLFWTEDSRLHTVVDDRHHSYYAYDHAGGSCGSRAQSQACLSYAEMQQRRRSQRTLKVTGHSHQLDVNAWLMHTVSSLRQFTVYPSPYVVLSNYGYTKHYYAGTERLAARQGGGFGRTILGESTELAETATRLFDQTLHQAPQLATPPEPHLRQEGHLDALYNFMMKDIEIPENLDVHAEIEMEEFLHAMQNLAAADPEPDVYFYHSDHLGSASWITDATGIPVQHLQYLPYGEPYINQRVSGYSERFTFTGKERDAETGYGYFGARYMDHEPMTMWLSVDPMSDKYPSISPYAYCAWNPIRLVDPDGKEAYEWQFDVKTNELIKIGEGGGEAHQTVTVVNPDGSSFVAEGDGRDVVAQSVLSDGNFLTRIVIGNMPHSSSSLASIDGYCGNLDNGGCSEVSAGFCGTGNIIMASASAAGHNAGNVAEYIANEVSAIRQGNPKMANRVPSPSLVSDLTLNYKVGKALRMAGRYGGGVLAGFNVGLQWHQFGQNKTVGNFTRAAISTMALGVGLCSGPVAAACVLGWGIFDLAVGDRVFNGW